MRAMRADGEKRIATPREHDRFLADVPGDHLPVGEILRTNALREIGPGDFRFGHDGLLRLCRTGNPAGPGPAGLPALTQSLENAAGDTHQAGARSFAGYFDRTGSIVTICSPCSSAWQTSIRSNGSRWCCSSVERCATDASSIGNDSMP